MMPLQNNPSSSHASLSVSHVGITDCRNEKLRLWSSLHTRFHENLFSHFWVIYIYIYIYTNRQSNFSRHSVGMQLFLKINYNTFEARRHYPWNALPKVPMYLMVWSFSRST
jgi:hypothetical protein